MQIGEFLEKTKHCTDDYKIKISNLYSFAEDTQHVKHAQPCYMYKDYALVFEINWDIARTVWLGDVRKFVKDAELEEDDDIVSWDSDDGNIIRFKKVIISEGTITIV